MITSLFSGLSITKKIKELQEDRKRKNEAIKMIQAKIEHYKTRNEQRKQILEAKKAYLEQLTRENEELEQQLTAELVLQQVDSSCFGKPNIEDEQAQILAALPPLPQVNSEFIDALESELEKIPIEELSLGDVVRMQTIFMNQLERINTYMVCAILRSKKNLQSLHSQTI